MKQTRTSLFSRAYASPEASLVDIREEQNFTATTGGLQDLGTNPLYEDDFDEVEP